MEMSIEALSNPDKSLIEYLKYAMLIKECVGLEGDGLRTKNKILPKLRKVIRVGWVDVEEYWEVKSDISEKFVQSFRETANGIEK